MFTFTKKQSREIAYGTKTHPKVFRKASPLESVIEAKVVAYAKSKSCLVYKFTSPSRRSVPDRLFIKSGGGVFFIEFKREGKKLTPAQEVEIQKMRVKGVSVYVVADVESGRNAVNLELL